MITGIKTAEGFAVLSESRMRRGGTLGGDVPLVAAVPGLALGSEVGAHRESGDKEAYTVEGEVVIAYRVVVIGKRGWRGEDLELAEYRGKDRERMLGDDDSDGNAREDIIEVTEVGAEDIGLQDDDGEKAGVKKVIVESDEGEVAVLSMDDEMEG